VSSTVAANARDKIRAEVAAVRRARASASLNGHIDGAAGEPVGLPRVPRAEPVSTARRTSWNARELLDADFPEPRWAVPGLVAEGLNLLVGPPKIGKSWLVAGLGVSVASGGVAMGRVKVVGGDVLYLALEDPPRRLQSRLRKILAGDPASERLTIATSCETLTAGGSERIAAWLEAHPEARLVIVDVFARVRGPVPAQSSAYDADYVAMARLKTLADRFGVAIVVVHHTRKSSADDFLDTVSGTQGLAGAADAILVLRRTRGSSDATLSVTGRDIEETDYALSFDPALGAWAMLDGPAQDYALGDTRRVILEHLRERGMGTPRQISDAVSLNYETVKKTCKRMFDADQLDSDGQGTYLPLSPVSPVSLTGGDGDTGDTRDTLPRRGVDDA